MSHHHHAHHPHGDGRDEGPSHDLEHEIFDIAPDHGSAHHHHGDDGSTLYHDHDGDIQHDHFVADAVLGAVRIEKYGLAYHEHDE